MDAQTFATREDFWRLQTAVNDLSSMQAQHTDRIMRLEKKANEDSGKSKGLWGPSSPFPSALNASHADSTLNPAAEAFRNFDNDHPSGMISSLTLDTNDEARRAASRANSVRFDESANHYAPSRQSIDLPPRTGSGLGSHPMSERSLSHRSDGRASNIGFGRANSFGLEGSRLLGSFHNSPRVSGHPPPALFALGPCPAIVRCWLTETFTNDALLYAVVCTGAAVSSIGLATLQHLGLDNSIIEENGLKKIRLLVYLTEAKIYLPSSRSASPSPSVPTVTAKFIVDEQPAEDKSIQIVLGSDVLRMQSADLLLSQDKLVIYDDDRNQLSVPLVRPEDDNAYRHLILKARSRSGSMGSEAVPYDAVSEFSTPGVIGRPSRLSSINTQTSPRPASPTTNTEASAALKGEPKGDAPRTILTRANTDIGARMADEARSAADADPSSSTLASKTNSGVWSNSWRTAAAGSASSEASSAGKSSSSYLRNNVTRPMKVLRPGGKTMANAVRVSSTPSTPTNGAETNQVRPEDSPTTQAEPKPTSTRVNPVGSASAFGWLNSGQQRKTTTSGGL